MSIGLESEPSSRALSALLVENGGASFVNPHNNCALLPFMLPKQVVFRPDGNFLRLQIGQTGWKMLYSSPI